MYVLNFLFNQIDQMSPDVEYIHCNYPALVVIQIYVLNFLFNQIDQMSPDVEYINCNYPALVVIQMYVLIIKFKLQKIYQSYLIKSTKCLRMLNTFTVTILR
jgi:hypothetical protein